MRSFTPICKCWSCGDTRGPFTDIYMNYCSQCHQMEVGKKDTMAKKVSLNYLQELANEIECKILVHRFGNAEIVNCHDLGVETTVYPRKKWHFPQADSNTPIDTLVYPSWTLNDGSLSYFAGFKEGQPSIFQDGRSSLTAKEDDIEITKICWIANPNDPHERPPKI